MKGQPVFLIAVLMGLAGFGDAFGGGRAFTLRPADISSVTPADTTIGRYYVLTLTIPGTIEPRNVDGAMLELCVNVEAKTRDDYTDTTPLLEAYALIRRPTGEITASDFDRHSPSVRPVRTGANRIVRLDVTPFVKGILSNPTSNHGLVLGSLTGQRDGDFTIVSGGLPDGSTARLTVYVTEQ